MIVHLLDGTYELFRHFYGARRGTGGKDARYGAVIGLLNGALLGLIEADRPAPAKSPGRRYTRAQSPRPS